jgi:hypothetical protein
VQSTPGREEREMAERRDERAERIGEEKRDDKG